MTSPAAKRSRLQAENDGTEGSSSSKKNRRLQMADVARLAGVSISTVSRALSGSEVVNPKTRQRIEELARSLSYSINVGAKNLRLGENKTVGVVIPYDAKTRQHISDPFFLAILGSIADALTDEGFDMLLSRVDSERLDLLSELHNAGRTRGIIVIGQWGHHDQLNELAARHVPIVVWGAQLDRQLYCSVGGDNLAGGRLATAHLLAQGRRRIAFLGDTRLPEVALRYDGFVQAHRDHGIAPDPHLVQPVPFLPDSARGMIAALCTSGYSFDGMFACSDLLAMTATGLMFEHGLQVPRDVALVGYDDVEASSHFRPSLTTIRQPIASAGKALVNSLLQLLRGERVKSLVLPTELVVRESTRVEPPT